MLYFDKINNKKILKSDCLNKERVFHCFTTRESVVTARDLTELTNVANKNLYEIAKHLNINIEDIIIPEQIHSDTIKIANKTDIHPVADSLILDNPNLAILLNFADCTPVILYDTQNNIGAIAHAGWKGTAASIVPKTLKKMKEIYSTEFENITAIIGPSISINNYEVGEEVYQKLKNTLKKNYNDWFIKIENTEKYKVDLKLLNQHQLKELGVSRIDKCEYCTYDSIDVFFSYRKEYGITARHSAILKLVK